MTSAPLTVTAAQHSYAIQIEEGLLGRLGAVVDGLGAGHGQVFVVSSPTVWRLHGATLTGSLPGAKPILIPDGERFKQLPTVARIYDALIRAEADRSATLLAFGGGVVGDIAGFAAATYLRGIRLVQVPTTLLAQVDSSVGGKVGVNHPLGKNLIGSFYPPALVVIDPLVLGTLHRREFRAGLYEVLKYGVIASPPLFTRVRDNLADIFKRDGGLLSCLIEESCRIKAAIVSRDEREAGPRRVLNFGHTAGHAIEAVTKYRRFRHGEAIAYGMLVAAEIAAARGALPAEDLDALNQVVTKMGPLPPVVDLSTAEIVAVMRRDKKVVRGTLHFVLPTAIGSVAIVDDVAQKEIERALRAVGIRR